MSSAAAAASRTDGELVYSVRVDGVVGDEVYFLKFDEWGDCRTSLLYTTKAAAKAGSREVTSRYIDDSPDNPTRSHLTFGPVIETARLVR